MFAERYGPPMPRGRPYAPNEQPWNYPIAGGMARLLERIWKPTCGWLPYPQSHGVDDTTEHKRRVRAWAGSVLDALECEHQQTHPDSHNEAIVYQDRLFFQRAEARQMDPAGRVWEIGRMISQGAGIVVLERITTWLRATPTNPEDGSPVGPTIEFKEGSWLQFGPPAINPATNGSLFPFPFAHPVAGVSPLRLRWNLILQRMPYESQGFPPIVSIGALDAVPTGEIRGDWPSEWEDMRYRDQALGGVHHKWVGGGHGMVRLFATIFADVLSWRVEVAGRLTGYRQQAGRRAAALQNATRRH